MKAQKLELIVENGLNEMQHYINSAMYKKVDFQKGDILLRQGEQIKHLFWVESGSFTISHTAANGRKLNLGLIRSDQKIFGEVEMFSKAACQFDLTAFSESSVYIVPVDDMIDILINNPFISIWISHSISLNYVCRTEFTANRILYPLSYNIAMDIFINYITGKSKGFDLQYKEAERFGCSERVYIREVKKLEASGIIQRENGKIVEFDKDKIIEYLHLFSG